MATLLLELFSEEIPSRMQRGAAEQLQRLMMAGFEKNGVKPRACRTYVSPRHLAIQCDDLPAEQPDVKEEKRGPKIGAPEQALKGFLQSTGLTLEQCEQRDGYYYATIERKGRSMAALVQEVCEAVLSAFVWPKSMKWGAHGMQWVRPLHSMVCLLDDAVVPVTFGHLTAGNTTRGHRFLAPEVITIKEANGYEGALHAAKVMVNFEARREKIAAEIAAVASAAKLTLREDAALLDEVTGLVEWPVPLLCTFDAKFLDLPPEVLISEMKNHQRYFALYGADGTLTNQFITVANMVNADGGARVKDGNARVVRARLADGEFYWEQDRKTSLEDWGKKLSDVVFHAKVGMMDEKVARIEALAVAIAKAVGFADTKLVSRAAQLAKADLTSGMVGEFPELQGIMGRYYANAQGESKDVAEAIYEHYKPQGAGDSLPETTLGAIISLADKLDSIVSLFAAGEKPTGSKDPLALRRAALGVIRVLLRHEWHINLSALGANDEVISFFVDRLKTQLKEQGMRHDVVEAVLAVATGADMLGLHQRVVEMNNFANATANPERGANTVTAIKRALNILAAEEKKEKKSFAANAAGAESPAEKAIATALATLDSRLRGNDRNPEALEALTAPINAFFTDHLVNEEGKRDTRLSLLAAVREAAFTIADFSKIEG